MRRRHHFGLAAVLAAVVVSPAAASGVHPRLFFGPEDIPALRERSARAPFADMIETAALGATVRDGASAWVPRPHYAAMLYVATGDRAWADRARDQVLQTISTAAWRTSGNALDRGTAGGQVAVAYDLCRDAWVGQVVPATVVDPLTGATVPVEPSLAGLDLVAVVSRELRDNGDRLMASGGSGWPGDLKVGNNWHAVRYGGAGLSYLATDDPVDPVRFANAVNRLITHFRANLGPGADSRGWNVEGIGYLGFPGQTSLPFAVALRRNADPALGAAFVRRDLRVDVPGLAWTSLTLYPGALAQERRHPYFNDVNRPDGSWTFRGLGLRPDFNDDHPVLMPEGTAALGFALAPPEVHGGMKWMFRRLWGDLGDRTWDSVAGQALWAWLFWPEDVPERDPAEAWGLAWSDPAMGMFVLRNRYRDATDTVFQATANRRDPQGGHGGPDDLSFRLWSLGVPWVVGGGRNYADPVAGQTTLSPADPSTVRALVPAAGNRVADRLLRTAGDGFLVLRSDRLQTGVEDVARRYVVDHDSVRTGAESVVIVSDASANGAFWRLNTPSFHAVATDAAAGTFTITSPEGHSLRGRVLWPRAVAFRTSATVHDRTHVRFPYRDVGYTGDRRGWDTSVPANANGNRWVDFATPDGRALVVLTVAAAGNAHPSVSATGDGDRQDVTVGGRTYRLDGDRVDVAGWERPLVAIVAPVDGARFTAGATDVPVVVDARVPDGLGRTIGRVALFLDDEPRGEAVRDGDVFRGTVAAVPVGEHRLRVVALDDAGNDRAVERTFTVFRSIPPVAEVTWPAPGQEFHDQQRVVLRGTCADADGTVRKVEVWWNGVRLGDAAPGSGGAPGLWQYAVTARPAGTHRVQVVVEDDRGDRVAGPERTFVFRRRFAAHPVTGDAGRWSANVTDTGRWTTWLDADGDVRLRTRFLSNYWVRDGLLAVPGSEVRHWRLSFRARVDVPPGDPRAYLMVVLTGDTRASLVLDSRATVRGPSWNRILGGTRVLESFANGGGILPTLAWHPVNLDGSANPNLAGVPVDADGRFRGVRGAGWQDVRLEKVGRRLRVWVDDTLILDGEDLRLDRPGPVYLSGIAANAEYGGHCLASFDDVEFTPLEADGAPRVDAPGAIAIAAPLPGAVGAAGAPLVVAGTATDADGIERVEVFAGFRLLGTAVPDPATGAWSLAATVPSGVVHGLGARLVDRAGRVAEAEPVTVRVGAPNAAPAVTLASDPAVAAPARGVVGTATDADGSVTLVQLRRGGTVLGAAPVVGGTWRLTLSEVLPERVVLTAVAFDDLGRTAEATLALGRTPFEAWAAERSLPARPEADTDGDGLADFVEFALGGDPARAVPAEAPALRPAGVDRLAFTFRRARADVVYRLEASADLATWQVVAVDPGVVGEVVDFEWVLPPGAPIRFLRLAVEPRDG